MKELYTMIKYITIISIYIYLGKTFHLTELQCLIYETQDSPHILLRIACLHTDKLIPLVI